MYVAVGDQLYVQQRNSCISMYLLWARRNELAMSNDDSRVLNPGQWRSCALLEDRQCPSSRGATCKVKRVVRQVKRDDVKPGLQGEGREAEKKRNAQRENRRESERGQGDDGDDVQSLIAMSVVEAAFLDEGPWRS